MRWLWVVRLRDGFVSFAGNFSRGYRSASFLERSDFSGSRWQYLHIFNYGQYHWLVALTVGTALVGVVLWGTLSGAMLPFLLRRCGLDPATSSAPFVATLVDVTGLVIYFNVALFILRGTLL